jgi:hypothetical protein
MAAARGRRDHAVMTSTVSVPRWGLVVLTLGVLTVGATAGFLIANARSDDGTTRVLHRETVLTYVNRPEPGGPVHIRTKLGAFTPPDAAWESSLLHRARVANETHNNARNIPIRMTYGEDGTVLSIQELPLSEWARFRR